jgi:hypothetical protein
MQLLQGLSLNITRVSGNYRINYEKLQRVCIRLPHRMARPAIFYRCEKCKTKRRYGSVF